MTDIYDVSYWGEDDWSYVLVAYDLYGDEHEVHSIPLSEMADWLLLNLRGTSGLLGVWSGGAE